MSAIPQVEPTDPHIDEPALAQSSPEPAPQPPLAVAVRRRNWWSWAWLAPMAALLAAAWLGYQAYTSRGPIITIVFDSGDGIGAGDPISYREVQVGRVRAVKLSEDLRHVVVSAQLATDAAGLAVEGSRFWIVRPEISAGRISGLDTLLGPRYIAVDPGSGPPADRFVGIPRAPVLEQKPEQPGDSLRLVLQATHRGSLNVGSPVNYRGIKVGAVTDISLSYDGRAVDVVVEIEGRFGPLVRSNTKFWTVAGIGADFGWWRGLSVRTASLESVLVGGVELATPTRAGPPVRNGAKFILHAEPDSDWLQWSPALLDPSPG